MGRQPLQDVGADPWGKLIDATIDEVKDYLLSQYPWSFAKKQTVLSLINETPRNLFSYAYQVPSDYVIPVTIYMAFDQDKQIKAQRKLHIDEWEIVGNILYSNVKPLILMYITELADIDSQKGVFNMVASYYVASILAPSLMENEKLALYYREEYEHYLNEAVKKDQKHNNVYGSLR